MLAFFVTILKSLGAHSPEDAQLASLLLGLLPCSIFVKI